MVLRSYYIHLTQETKCVEFPSVSGPGNELKIAATEFHGLFP